MLMGAGGYEAFEEECAKLSQRQLRALGGRKNSRTDRYEPPSDTTFFRVLNGLDAAQFDLRIGQWMMGQEISILQGLGADYLWGLKGNQSGILEQAQKRLPKDFFSLSIRYRLDQRTRAAGSLAPATGHGKP
jgi:hypothetical protein